MKRILSFCLVFCMLLVLPLPLTAATTSDIAGHWAEKSITELMQAGFISGYPDGTFKPDNAITRAEFLKIITSVLGLAPASSSSSSFSDVSSEDWFFGYIMAAVEKGIVSGYPDGTFKPNNPITRQEAAKIVVKAEKIDETQANPAFTLSWFTTDGDQVAEWAKPFVAAAVENDIMMGDPTGAFRPTAQITRAETVTIGSRLMPAHIGGTFIFGRGQDSSSLDPAGVWQTENARATIQIFDTLVSLRGETTKIKPCLATEWSVSPDNLTWTFKLRQGVKFHDGTDFNADAVVFNFERWWDKDNPYHKGSTFDPFSYMFGGFKGEDGCVLKAVNKVDDYTVEFILTKPFSPLLSVLSMYSFAISSPTAIKNEGPENYGTSKEYPPVGTGPFKFSDWIKDDKLILVRNDDYWGVKAKIDKFIFRVIPDNAARYLSLKTGEINAMDGANIEDAIKAKTDPDLQVLLRPPFNIAALVFKCDTPPFNDARIRKAIAMAIDKKEIVKTFLGEFGLVANQLLPPSLWGYNKDLQDYPYDPEAAKALLAEVAPNGLPEIDFWYMSNPRQYLPDPKGVAEAIAADLAKIGVRCNLKTEDWASYTEDWYSGKFPMFLAGWSGDIGDPDNFLYTFFGVKNGKSGFYENSEVSQLLNEARIESDLNKRAILYQQAAAIIHEDCPMIFISNLQTPILLSNKVKGYVVNPTCYEAFNTVWLTP